MSRWIILCLFSATLVSCSAISIETGATAEEQSASNANRASQYRREWASRFSAQDKDGQIRMVKIHVDSSAGRYEAFGKDVVDQWKQGSAGRGAPISDDEMRIVVDKWVMVQKPLLDANDEILEFGLARLKERGDVSPEVLSLFFTLSTQYYDLHGAAFFPSGTIEQHENRIFDLSNSLRETSDKLERLLK